MGATKEIERHGLPFVAWTRSESFAMTAFKNLPPWNDFVKGIADLVYYIHGHTPGWYIHTPKQ